MSARLTSIALLLIYLLGLTDCQAVHSHGDDSNLTPKRSSPESQVGKGVKRDTAVSGQSDGIGPFCSIAFDKDDSILTPEAEIKLQEVSVFLASTTGPTGTESEFAVRIVVRALRCDDAELDETTLAQDRANAFRQYLERLNVPSDKIIVETEDVLLDAGKAPSLRQRNKLRRVDIYIVKDDQPGGGKMEYQASTHPTRAQTENEYAITSALTQFVLFCLQGGDLPADTPEEPTEEPRSFIEEFFSGLAEFVTEGFRNAMSDEVMAQQSQILKHLPDMFGTDPEAELGLALTAKTLDVAYPSAHPAQLPKDGRIDCLPVDPSDSPNYLQSIREECGTFVVHTIEDATLSHPQATLRLDLILFPKDDSNGDTPPPDAPRYIQPTVLHLVKDPEWRIIAIQT